MKETIAVSFVIIMLVVIGAGITMLYHKPAISGYWAAIEQCEAELPRDQHCVITAIPEVNDENLRH